MARKSKFALQMKDGVEVCDLVELRRAFDPDAIMKYFRNGSKLVEWLRDRYYDGEADAISKIASDDPDAARKICAALKVCYEDYFDAEFAARVKVKRDRLSKITNDIRIIENARNTAFNQQDLADLLDLDESVIYLCGETFTVPTRVENKRYIGVLGIPTIETTAKSKAELDEKHIVIEKCRLPWDVPSSDPNSDEAFDDHAIRVEKRRREILKQLPEKLQSGAAATTSIKNAAGMHARPASQFVQKASAFQSDILIVAKGKTVDAKSILPLMSTGLVFGTELTIVADGFDEKEAVRSLKSLIESKFGEI